MPYRKQMQAEIDSLKKVLTHTVIVLRSNRVVNHVDNPDLANLLFSIERHIGGK